MTIYLTIITTALVITQIIRLVQNAVQLKRNDRIETRNKLIERVYAKLEEWLDKQNEYSAMCWNNKPDDAELARSTSTDSTRAMTDSESTQSGAIRSARGDAE